MMTDERARVRFTARDVPEADALVVGARSEGFGVGRPGEGGDACEVAGESVDVFSRAGVPDADSSVGGGGGDESLGGGDADAADVAFVAAEGES